MFLAFYKSARWLHEGKLRVSPQHQGLGFYDFKRG